MGARRLNQKRRHAGPRIVSNRRRRVAERGVSGLKDRPRAGKKPIYGKATNKRMKKIAVSLNSDSRTLDFDPVNGEHYDGGCGGAVPCAHFSIFPRAPQAPVARNRGMAMLPRPADEPRAGMICDSGTSGPTVCKIDVANAPMIPIALFLPSSRFPIVWPSAPFTCPSLG